MIRPVRPSDVDGLAALYADLDPEDRYLRFFSAYSPSRSFLERMSTVAERGGIGLVATVPTAGEGDHIVGEAGYTMLPNGDGELAITVDGRWRGGLGSHLLDVLVSAAAARGVPNLEAEVLITNRPMLALARARGCVTMEHADWTVVRLLIGVASATPVWPGPHDRPRVLVEGGGGRWHVEGSARAAGLQVLVCAGPSGRRTGCPALDSMPCPLAAGADAIVVSHPPEEPEWLALLGVHGHLHPGVPVCVEAAVDGRWTAMGQRQIPETDDAGVVAFVQRLAQPTASSSPTESPA